MTDTIRNQLLFGSAEPPPEWIPLHAGPLSLFFTNGDLRYIRLGGREVLRRIYVAVRVANWWTVPIRLRDLDIRSDANSFSIGFVAEHCEREIDFAWAGEIEGSPDGSIQYRMNGEARATFLRNRIGICVLHPAGECCGVPCKVGKVDGSTQRGVFPRLIAPHQPFRNIRSIEHPIAPGVNARVEFSGDVFEMEDQRNWSDASFKTYSTPLDLPFPVEVAKGTKLTQSVCLRLGESTISVPGRSALPLFEVRISPAVPIPAIGLGMASHGEDHSPKEIRRLKALNLHHLRADLHLPKAGWEHPLERAEKLAGSLGLRLELAVFVSDEAEIELQQLEAHIRVTRPGIGSLLILHESRKAFTADRIHFARELFKTVAPEAGIGAGTDVYFAEWNRRRQPFDALDLTCFSVNPQVHAFDNATLVENLRGLGYMIESAVEIAGGKPIAVSPLTFRPRYQAGATHTASDPVPGSLPLQVDARQVSIFGAGWTACSLKYLADPHVCSITYYETSGWRGVMETEAGSPLPALFPSQPDSVFPLYHVLKVFGEYRGGKVLETYSSHPLCFDGVALENRGKNTTLLCSWLAEPQTVRIAGLAGIVSVRRLNAQNALLSMTDPGSWRFDPRDDIPFPDDGLEICLQPFELICLESEGGK